MSIKDTDISTLSYTEKDFASIYPELLNLAKQLTNKWDPEHSNESDPGVVLLKEAAFVADHNNYNIDKNILENFLPSATQDKSVRNIVEMNGYIPRYYVSATSNLSLKWTYDSESGETNSAFTIPAFTLTATDAEGTITYTQIEDITILGDGIVSSGKFMEGTLQTLAVNSISTITMENIDDNNRIYLPETMVAQNGIYISNANQNDWNGYWERDNYLLTRPNESRIYKIDYDSTKGLPYIEFPTDIANIIGDGLIIKYITTSGLNGNVSANTIVNINSPTDFYAYNETEKRSVENISITNTNAITNGKDPETIDEMYKSYKKVVGTFDTLVTCKDYTNKINSLEYSDSSRVVSNAYVTDRRTDYNKALNVITYDEYKEFFKNISLKNCKLTFRGAGSSDPDFAGNLGDLYCVTSSTGASLKVYDGTQWKSINNTINLNDFAQLTAAMSHYDLTIYALTAFSMNDYISSMPQKALNNSFTPITNLKLSEVKNLLTEEKCISHTYNDCASNDIFCFKNYLPLNVTIQPFNKVTLKEKNEIVDNVYKALSSAYNSSQLLFGEELDYTNVRNTIVNADSRISDAYVKPFEYSMKAMLGDGTEVDPYTTKLPTSGGEYKIIVDMIAKNVLAGRVCLFNIDDDFSFRYGQTVDVNAHEGIYSNIKSISTKLNIGLEKANISSQTNESVTTNKAYTSTYNSGNKTVNIKYIFNCPNKDSATNRKDLAYNDSYTLTGSDYFKLVYTANGKSTTVEYRSHDNTTYTISNKIQGVNLLNLDTTELTSVTASGTINIQETVVNTSYTDNFVNLNNYTLNANECIQIISPNYYSAEEYSTGVSYRYEGSKTISANSEHELTSQEKIILQYTSDSVTKTTTLTAGDIVKCSFDLAPTDTVATSGVTTKIWTDTTGSQKSAVFKSLASGQTIAKRSLMKTILDSKYMLCYWIINSAPGNENRLFNVGETTKILEADDYFIYANSTLDEMVILGSGTKLARTDTNDSQWLIKNTPISIETINDQGTSADLDWQVFDFSEHNLEVIEMSIVNLCEGDSVTISGWDIPSGVTSLSNDWVTCNGTIVYTINGTANTLSAVDDFYQIRSRLDINTNNTSYQELYDGQQITITTDTVSQTLSKKGMRLQANYDLNLVGSEYINLSALSDLGIKLSIYAYEPEDVTSVIGGTTDKLIEGDSGYVISLDDKDGTVSLPFCYNPIYEELPTLTKRAYLLPIYINGDEIPITVQVKNNGKSINIREFNSGNNASSSLSFTGTNLFYVEIPVDSVAITTTLTLELSWKMNGITLTEPEIIVIDKFVTTKSTTANGNLNELLTKSGVTASEVYGRIKEIIDDSDTPSIKPYYGYTPENSIAIENPDFSDPAVLWDINNVANIMSIPQLDLENSDIDIAISMRNY